MREYICFCDIQIEVFRGKEVKCLLSNVLGKEERNGWKDGWTDRRILNEKSKCGNTSTTAERYHGSS